MIHSLRFLLCFLGLWISLPAWGGESVSFKEKELTVPALAVKTEGRAIGLSNKATLVIGGFDATTQQPTNELLILPPGESAWRSQTLSEPLAYTAVANRGESVLCIGGLSTNGASARVTELSYVDGKVVEKSLPPLPSPRLGAAVAVVKNVLYVCGGQSLASGGVAQWEKTFWSLDLVNPEATWQVQPDWPGEPTAFAASTSQYDMFCIFGGVRANGQISQETWTYRPRPLEGTDRVGWMRMKDLPAPTAYATAVPIGQASVLLLGGRKEAKQGSVLNTEVAAQSTELPLLYHTVTDAWTTLAQPIEARAPLIQKNGLSVEIIAGEGQPGKSIVFPTSARSLAWLDYIVIAAYFLIVAGIGFYFSTKQESSAEFSLGNRSVPWWAAGISMFATGASAISFMAIPALAFATNLVWLFPIAMIIPAYFILSRYIFSLLRKLEITSTYEYLERRFNVPLRLIASAQCMLIQTFGRSAIVLVLPSLAIATTTGMNVFHSVILMGILTTVYTALGGFQAVIWTEVFQGIIKTIAPILLIVLAIMALPGGMGEFVQIGVDYHKFDWAVFSWEWTVPAVWILLTNTFVQETLGKAGDQPTVQRIFSSPTHEVRRVTMMNAVCGIGIGILVNVMGLAIFAYFHANPHRFDPTAQNDQIVPLFVTQATPIGVTGLIIAAIFASAMATVASAMNSVATIYTEDFYQRWHPQATDQKRLFVMRCTSYVVGFLGTVIALLLAALDIKSMMVVWSQVASLLGGGIVGVFSLGMFTKRVNGFGAICGAVGSMVVTLLIKLYTPLHWGTYAPIAIFSCIIIGYLCSLFSPQTKDLTGLTVFAPKRDNLNESKA